MSKILIAEDDQTMVSLLNTLLKMEGHEVIVLDPAADIPAAVQSESPDCLLMDVHIGRQNGMEIVAELRKDPGNARVRIVMASGYNVKDECLQRGADHFLLKPFMPDDLLNLMK